MKVTYPHMGNLFLAANAFLRGLGCEIVQPPFCSKKTLSLGTARAPESACLPLKINLGNYLEALENGADTVVMVGGIGPCRIGYYGQVQKYILEDLGCRFTMIVLEPPDAHFQELWQKIMALKKNGWLQAVHGAVLAWKKIYGADTIERQVQILRPRVKKVEVLEEIYEKAILSLDQADTSRSVKKIIFTTMSALKNLPQQETDDIIKIGIVGEIYTILEPFSNLNLEKHLGRLGVEVERSLYLSQWINEHLLGGLLPLKSLKQLQHLARPFLNHFVGGHGRESVGSAVDFAKRGFDGVIQVGPLTCMPEIVAQAILPAVGEAYHLPIMTIYVDEQTGEAGLITRLEAFVDMVRHQKVTNNLKERVAWESI